MAENQPPVESGSWWPLVVIVLLLVVRWLAFGQGNTPVQFRRWYNMQVRFCLVLLFFFNRTREECMVHCSFTDNLFPLPSSSVFNFESKWVIEMTVLTKVEPLGMEQVDPIRGKDEPWSIHFLKILGVWRNHWMGEKQEHTLMRQEYLWHGGCFWKYQPRNCLSLL